MLANVLTFQEREAANVGNAVDLDALQKIIDSLHKNDSAVERYFGVGRQEFVEKVESHSVPAESFQHPSIEYLKEKIRVIGSLGRERLSNVDGQCDFEGFYRAFYCYFKKVFEYDPLYAAIDDFVNAESLLLSVKGYVVSTVERLSQRTLVHCLNTRISEGADNNLEAFNHFLNHQAIDSVLESYPVLTSLLIQQMENSVAYLYKVIFHFAEDAEVLAKAFALTERRIDSIDLGLGDPHANGETVCAVQVADRCMIYKPRSNMEAQFYNSLLALLHQRSGDGCFSVFAPKLVCRANHCWIEKIENLSCESEHELALFYRRMGAQIAVIHALNGIDFHCENIIACGSNPVMIDLECLFTASLIDLKFDRPGASALLRILKSNSQSVFATGFVPHSSDSERDHSGLSSERRFTSSVRCLILEEGFYYLKRIKVDSTTVFRHLPCFDGEYYSLGNYQSAFLEGFEFAYDEVMRNRGVILELIEQNAGQLKSRVLIKNTQRYSRFIELTLHPRFMQCMLQRQILLATVWAELGESLIAKNIPGHELIDLEKANIPSFTVPVDSNCLFSTHGSIVAELEIESPLENCRKKLNDLSPKDKAFQRFILSACLFPLDNQAMLLNGRHIYKGVPSMSRSHYLKGATKIAAVIERLGVTGKEGDIGWPFLNSYLESGRNFISPMGNSLYNGMGGLAVFFMSLYRVSGRLEHLARANQIVDSMNRNHEHFESDVAVSAYFGLASYIYVLVNHQMTTGQDIYRPIIDELLLKLNEFRGTDNEIDFLHGGCGTVTLLVNLYQLQRWDSLIPLIEKFSAAIQAELVNEEARFARKTCRTPLLTGFSHGISGILQALCKVYEVTGDPALVALITDLLEDENRQKDQGLWLDLRVPSKPTHMTKWCHGSAGILISRLQLKKVLWEVLSVESKVMLEGDINTCEESIWKHGLGMGYSLCHGDFGNLMCLLELYRSTDNGEGVARCMQAFSEVADNLFNEHFMEQDSVPVLGMMLGLAGAGQALLYAIDSTVPNVLTLAFMGAPAAAFVQDHSDVESLAIPLH
ncbi:type 2 lanthipeptide synthetase LanM [Pseudomonas sp. NFX224]|uniref:type 2 lanthipeptide synthetase LanM n=1 Tax=Pseudomonas sp. NFX224 TaxID=3402862 RepID=UPI003AFB7AC6